MKIRKNALVLTVIASLLLTFVVASGFAQMTTVSVDCVEDTGLIPCSDFYVNVYVTDVEKLWGYQFYLSYDTTVLTATGYTNNPIFSLPEPGEINTDEGYVFVAYHFPYGHPVGFTGSTWIAKVYFHVEDYGASQLDLHDVILSDVLGEKITHVAIDCHFLNVAGLPVASFYWSPETPTERETVTFTSTSIDPDGYIVAWDWDFGDGGGGGGAIATHAYRTAGTYTVTLTVTDDEEHVDSFFDVVDVLPPPAPMGIDLHESKAEYRRFKASVREPETINTFTAMVKSLSPTETQTVRIVWSIWEFPSMEAMGSIEVSGTIDAKELKKFTGDFDIYDARWKFDGTARMDYEVRTEIFYVDYELLPGVPHWAKGTVNSETGSEWFSTTTLP